MSVNRIFLMNFSDLYPLYVQKAEKKGRTAQEVDEIICWLTGYISSDLKSILATTVNVEDFFKNAPALNENRKMITGKVCGVKVEEVTDPLMQELRYLDKLVDELSKGKSMESILRK